MNNQRPELLPFLLSAIALVGIIALTALSDPVPDILNQLAIATLVAGGTAIGGNFLGRGGPPPTA